MPLSGALARRPVEFLIRKLESIGSLSSEQCDALRRLEYRCIAVNAHEDIVREGDRPSTVTLVVQGCLGQYKVVTDGKRQILSFYIAGDIPDLPSLFLSAMDHSLCSLAPSQLAVIPRSAMLALFAAQPQLAYLFWRNTLIDAAIFRECMVGIGRRSAFTRVAHFFCEMIVRMQAVGLSSNYAIELPLTQTDIADALGLSTVHVNRTLQVLRGAGLIKLNRGTLVAIDWPGLRAAGEFDQSYLHKLHTDAAP
ncbi:MAG TPA: Crp/Fnr family transcriptional regulator [Xanthobacteraceae bacterium]|jgi:CRP-like cAMP-binding protein